MDEKIKKAIYLINYNIEDITKVIRAKTVIENPKLFTEEEYQIYLKWAKNVITDDINIQINGEIINESRKNQ